MTSPKASQDPVPRPGLRHVAAVAVGNGLEFYDFLVYAFFAAQIGRTFFPSADPFSSLMASLATFGAGFLMRPVGAVVMGGVGDRVGRKPAMLICFGLMGLAMVGLALTPSRATIGLAAPGAAIVFRLLQGFALGGDVGPSTAYLAEAAPPERRGLYVSLQFMGQYAATFCSGVVGFTLSSLIASSALDVWGWRAAFLLGAVIAPLGLALRRQLPDIEMAAPAIKSADKATGRFVLIVGLGVAMLTGTTTVTYVLNYLTTYASMTLHLPTTIAFAATAVVGLCGMAGAPLGGWLSDRYGRKPVMMAPAIVLFASALPAFSLVVHFRSPAALLGAAAGLSLCASTAFAVVMCAVTEGLPARTRSAVLGLMYACAISIFGGSTQFVVAWLTRLTHSEFVPAWYMTGGVGVGLAAMLLFPETAPGRPRRAAQSYEPAETT